MVHQGSKLKLYIMQGIIMAHIMPNFGQGIKDSKYRSAASHATLATYKQIGMEAFFNKVEQKYIPKSVQQAASYATWLAGVVEHKRITYGWNF